jgi:hypothetical protein
MANVNYNRTPTAIPFQVEYPLLPAPYYGKRQLISQVITDLSRIFSGNQITVNANSRIDLGEKRKQLWRISKNQGRLGVLLASRRRSGGLEFMIPFGSEEQNADVLEVYATVAREDTLIATASTPSFKIVPLRDISPEEYLLAGFPKGFSEFIYTLKRGESPSPQDYNLPATFFVLTHFQPQHSEFVLPEIKRNTSGDWHPNPPRDRMRLGDLVRWKRHYG